MYGSTYEEELEKISFEVNENDANQPRSETPEEPETQTGSGI
jgi:hypothetical protein